MPAIEIQVFLDLRPSLASRVLGEIVSFLPIASGVAAGVDSQTITVAPARAANPSDRAARRRKRHRAKLHPPGRFSVDRYVNRITGGPHRLSICDTDPVRAVLDMIRRLPLFH